ncbi:MAG: hypothetical protein D6714_05310 [Bacteroidetes bacterium]|nr:MAG: hypothetical protein D6714_05310 [Bacteroidota bacterium]
MKNFIWKTMSLLALSALFFTSCEDTPSGPVNAIPPDVFVTGPATVQPGNTIELTIEADKGDADLSALTISENGTNMDPARFLTFQVNGSDVTANNPLALNAFPDGFTLVATFEAPATVGDYEYAATVRDANSQTGSHSLTVRVESTPPSVSASNMPSEVVTGQTFFVNVDATKGDFPMTSLSVFEDGLLVDPARLTWDGATFADNPVALSGDQTDALSGTLGITAPSTDGSYAYTIQIADESGTTGETSFDVTINAGTPIDATLTTKLLSNQAGPAGKGALDLDQGLQAGVSTPGETTPDQTEIRDLGLDCTIPTPGFNWRRQIGTVNGAELRMVDLTVLENFTFDAVTTKEEIAGAFDTGITFADGESVDCATGATTPVSDVTNVVEAGDLFVVKSGSTYYLLRIESVNETDTDNLDYYEISIKH